MSTGANCEFEEREPNKWWYRLQEWPYGDWPEYDEQGPFPSEKAAHEHLHRYNANPGGYSVTPYAEYAEHQERVRAAKEERARREAEAAVAKPKVVATRRYPYYRGY